MRHLTLPVVEKRNPSLYYPPHRIIEHCKKEFFLKPDTIEVKLSQKSLQCHVRGHNQHLGDKEKCASGVGPLWQPLPPDAQISLQPSVLSPSSQVS